MRLSQFEIDTIKSLVKKYFGEDGRVFLFGSRTDDAKRGGDIDLFITNEHEQCLTLHTKIHFLSDLKKMIGNQKIDVVFNTVTTREKQNFYSAICSQQIEL